MNQVSTLTKRSEFDHENGTEYVAGMLSDSLPCTAMGPASL